LKLFNVALLQTLKNRNFEAKSIISAMGNLRPFELISVALVKPLKYEFFHIKSIKPVEKVPILALDMTF
jgi:hypothetical protein